MLKKILLPGTLALLSPMAYAGTVTSPETSPLSLTLSGSVAFQAGFYTSKEQSNQKNHREFEQKTKFYVHARNVADNGLHYGATIEFRPSKLDAQKKNRADKMFIWMSGNWGTINAGDVDGAGPELAVFAPNVGISQLDGSYEDYIPASAKQWVTFRNWNTNRDTKVSYYIPKFMGLEAGISYTPELGSYGEDVSRNKFANTNTRNNLVLFKDAIEVGTKYTRDIQDIKLIGSIGYTHAHAKQNAPVKNISSWAFGANIVYKDFKIGGGYVYDGKSAQSKAGPNTNLSAWNLGATYKTGPWGFGVNYITENLKNGAQFVKTVKDDSFHNTSVSGKGDVILLGANYVVAPGITLASDMGHFKHTSKIGLPTEKGYLLILQSKVDF